MKILFIHQSFPGQFKHLLVKLQAHNVDLSVICSETVKNKIPGISYFYYRISKGNGSDTHPLALETESKVIRGEAVAAVAKNLSNSGYIPNLIIAHPGWGESLFLKHIWPTSPQLHYVEYMYGSAGTDADFVDVHSPPTDWKEASRTVMKNANTLLNLNTMSWGLTPTHFQLSTLPEWARRSTSVIHDGINTSWAKPNKDATVRLKNGKVLSRHSEVITFVNRTFEPYRGIHIFIDALKSVLAVKKDAQVLLVGTNTPNVSYGKKRSDGKGWLDVLYEESKLDLDWSRIHILGQVSHDILLNIYQISSAHVYLTYPFVLSWSLLEAMSCECLIIASDTPPVTEVIKDNVNGFTVPFTSPTRLASKIIYEMYKKDELHKLRVAARQTILESYDLDSCLQRQLSLIFSLMNKTIVA